ncbi:GPP34 family phosphoprotein [Micromonospora sp. NPDC048930]|uniref:GPP34 family phosphoprotein n=1 Tax=Micromonospora sp. NPDC048930 TaxID=3364261 RepID=UPI003723CF69
MNPPDDTTYQHSPRHVQPDEGQRPARVVGTAPARPARLADDFFFVTHDDQSGRPRLHAAGVGLGLAAALLLELHEAGRVTFDRGQVRVLVLQPHFAESLSSLVVACFGSELVAAPPP